jgi:DNA topoisomerase-6 subunit B
MAAKQRDISVSEFFAKNRHLLGFDNPRKALLTTIKEAVDNALDACEEAGILPDIEVKIEALSPVTAAAKSAKYRITIWTTGPASSASRSRTSSGGCCTARSSTA